MKKNKIFIRNYWRWIVVNYRDQASINFHNFLNIFYTFLTSTSFLFAHIMNLMVGILLNILTSPSALPLINWLTKCQSIIHSIFVKIKPQISKLANTFKPKQIGPARFFAWKTHTPLFLSIFWVLCFIIIFQSTVLCRNTGQCCAFWFDSVIPTVPATSGFIH